MDLKHLQDGYATLLCNGREVAPVRIAASRHARYRGLLGEDGLEGAVLLLRTNGVHTLGMRFPIDVAYLSKDLTVIEIIRMKPNRWSRNRLRARHTLETATGRMDQWHIVRGCGLQLAHASPAEGKSWK